MPLYRFFDRYVVAFERLSVTRLSCLLNDLSERERLIRSEQDVCNYPSLMLRLGFQRGCLAVLCHVPMLRLAARYGKYIITLIMQRLAAGG